MAAELETGTVKLRALWLTPVPSRLLEEVSGNELESRRINSFAL